MQSTIDDLKTRRSCRAYKSEQISGDELNLVLEAGEYAPTGMGMQSPIMVVVQDKLTIKLLSDINAEIMGVNKDPFYGAPTVVVVLADSNRPTWVEDGSLVMGNLMNAAHAIGLGSCWINRARETFDRPEGKELLKKWGVPESYRGVGNCILGYPAAEDPKPKPRKENYIVRV